MPDALFVTSFSSNKGNLADMLRLEKLATLIVNITLHRTTVYIATIRIVVCKRTTVILLAKCCLITVHKHASTITLRLHYATLTFFVSYRK